jgi:hypothetical protein
VLLVVKDYSFCSGGIVFREIALYKADSYIIFSRLKLIVSAIIVINLEQSSSGKINYIVENKIASTYVWV